MTESRWIFLRIRNVSGKSCRENQNTHFMFNSFYFPPRKSRRLWDNVEKYGTAGQATDDNIIRRTRIACWKPKATNTHSEYEILIAFPQQQWLQVRASVLGYTFLLYFADRASQHIYLNINQLDALNFIMSLFQASTCFEHMCSSSGGQNCIIQPLVSSHL